jgi:hypothetical protein
VRAGSFVHPRLCVCRDGVQNEKAKQAPTLGAGRGPAYWRRTRTEPILSRGDTTKSAFLHLVYEEFGPVGSEDAPTAVLVRVANTGSLDACVVVRSDTVEMHHPQFVSTSLLPAVRTVPAGRSVVIGTLGRARAATGGDRRHDGQRYHGDTGVVDGHRHHRRRPPVFPPPLRASILRTGAGGCTGANAIEGNVEPCPDPHGSYLLEDALRRDVTPNAVVYESPVAPGSDRVLVEVRALSGMALNERADNPYERWMVTCQVAASKLTESSDNVDLRGVVELGVGGVLGIVNGVRDPPSPARAQRICQWASSGQIKAYGIIGGGVRRLNESDW